MSRRVEWAAYAVGLSFAAAAALYGASADWEVERTLRWARGSGWAALITLALALCASPVGRALGRSRRGPPASAVKAARRALGISAAALAAVHVTWTLSTLLGGAWDRVFEVPWLRAGAAAALILAALFVTSFPRAVAALRLRLWKPLHRLAYAAGLLAGMHALLAPMSDPAWVLGLGAAVVALAPLRMLPSRGRAADRVSSPAAEP